MPEALHIGPFEFRSRLFVGTGKYASYELMQQALEASGCQVVTVAVRRERLYDDQNRSLLDFIDLDRYVILPNTAGCFTVKDAIRHAVLARELLEGMDNSGSKWVKLEVLADKKTLLPDPVGTIEATKELVKDGFCVLVYTNDDPITCMKLKEAGASSVMPAGSPIGSGLGILNPNNIRIALEIPGDRGRRSGHGLRCHDRDGTGIGRRAAEYGCGRCGGSRANGPGHETRDRSGL